MNKSKIIKEIREALEETNKHRPFSKKDGMGDPKKDYYRGQNDALYWVLSELLGEEE